MKLTKKEKQWIRENLLLNPDHGSKLDFYCKKCACSIAKGYNRIVIGDRGPYIEFLPEHMIMDNIFIPLEQHHTYFIEYQSKCVEKIFIYHQRKTVKYADYRIGMYYIDPELLNVFGIGDLIKYE